MEENKDMLTLLEKVLQPVFCVKDGIILHANAAARQMFLEPGMEIAPLLEQSEQDYAAFREGSLYLSLNVCGQTLSGCVQRLDGLDIFELDTDGDSEILRALALAAGELRKPLGEALCGSDALLEDAEDPEVRTRLSRLNRNLYRILRILGNMSDAQNFAEFSRQETVNIPKVLEEVILKAGHMLESSRIRVQYEGLSEPVYALADRELLERAVLNILSNAAKFSPKDSTLRVSLTHRGRSLQLTVLDSGSGIADTVMGSLFRRYLRQPGIEDSRFGLGLGIRMIHSAALQHGGTLLISRGEDGGTRVVMTLALRQKDRMQLSSTVATLDTSGGYDRSLVELSDVLSAELFDGSF